MVEHSQLTAERIVQAFKARLSSGAREQISEADLDELRRMISEAITAEIGWAAGLVEEVASKLRAGIERPDLGL